MEDQIAQIYKPLFLYVRKRVSNQLDAEDITQEVFYKLSKPNKAEVKNIKSWIYAIAKNTIIDYYRKKKLITEEIENIVINNEYIESDAIDELSSCILPFINQLPEDYRIIMKLSELEGVSQKEIAKRLVINYTTVRSKVQRGRKKLKALISGCCTIIQGGKGSILDYKKKNNCSNDC